MRLALFTFCSLLFACALGVGQEAKKKGEPAVDKAGSQTKDLADVAGKTLEQWVKELSSKDPSRRELAMRMIVQFSPRQAQKAVPALIAELEKHKKTPIDLSVRINGSIALGTILSSVEKPDLDDIKKAVAIFKGFCKDEQIIVRTRAVQALAQLAPFSRPALPEVMQVARDTHTWEARRAGLEALTVMMVRDDKLLDGKVLALYYTALDDNSMQVRTTAIQGLAQFAHKPFELSEVDKDRLVKNLTRVITKDPEPSLHIWAHLAVMTYKHKLEAEHMVAIALYLGNPDPAVRVQAAQSLGMIGLQMEAARALYLKDNKKHPLPFNKEMKPLAIKHLVKALGDPNQDPTVLATVMTALAQVDTAVAVEKIPAMLGHRDANVRASAASTLANIGPDARVAESQLAATLDDPEDAVIVSCINALVQLDAFGTMPILQKMSASGRTEVIREAAAQAIRAMQQQKNKKGGNPKAVGP
jgi:HEAT repeat protein